MQKHSFSYDYDFAGHTIDVRYVIADGHLDAIEVGDWPRIEVCRSESRIALIAEHGTRDGVMAWDIIEEIRGSLGYPINLALANDRDREAGRRRCGVRRELSSSVG